ncbi:MAG: sigma-54-dependent transcriptional regulator [Chitinophagales bacterium]
MAHFKIFIVEDDPWYGELLEYHITQNPENEVFRFTTAKECLKNLNINPDLITIDFSLPDMNGEELIKKIQHFNIDIPLIVISGQENVSTAVSLLHKGIYDYFVKEDGTLERLWNHVNKIRVNKEQVTQITALRSELGKKYKFENNLKGESQAIKSTFSLIERASKSNINVSISGETGTGKELVAKAIHYNSDRHKKPFIAVNMAAIPKDLIESELFGYEKGAFTGAVSRKIGRFEEADKGTLFLDEIGDLDLNLQSKLLRVIQEKELTRLGGNDVTKFDVRLIIATHKNLAQEVRIGNFREDLYYRIIGLPIELAPLRDRGDDVILLAEHFLEEFTRENKLRAAKLSEQALKKLTQYHFPGNIRELKSIIEIAAVVADNGIIKEDDIRLSRVHNTMSIIQEEITLEEYKKRIIGHFLKKYDNNVLLVAKKLDIGKSTIYNILQSNSLSI